MKRFLLLLAVIFMNNLSGYCATNLFPPLKPLSEANPVPTVADNYDNSAQTMASNPNINKIEESLFGKSFANQNMPQRLSRIEKSLFSTTYPDATNAQRIDNIILNYNQISKYPNISKSGLSKMETAVFNQTYPQNNPERRIERLEQQMLGAVQSGNLDSRYNTLKAASRSYANPKNNPNYYKKAGLMQRIRDNFGNSNGYMTGYTPQVNPYNDFQPGVSGNSYNPYGGYGKSPSFYNLGGQGSSGTSSIVTPYGYADGYQNFNTQTGCGVTILD